MEIYDFMKKYNTIDFGQIFTPTHMATFAAKLIDIKNGDRVLDSCAGTGALLFPAVSQGCRDIYGIEIDDAVFETLEKNLKAVEDINYEVINDSALSASASDWIKSKAINKLIINPPYETKWKTYDILKNTIEAVGPGCMIALFYPDKKLEKASKKWKEWFLSHNRILKIIKMPKNLFSPYVCIETSLFIIQTGTPQENHKIFTCYIEDDGFESVKKSYPQDTKGKWRTELFEKWFTICTEETGDESCGYIDPAKHLSYQLPEVPFEISELDFKITAFDYLAYKHKINLKDLGISSVTPKTIELIENTARGIEKQNYFSQVEPKSYITIKLTDLFEKKKAKPISGSYKELPVGDTPVIGAGLDNCGIQCFADIEPTHKGKHLTINRLAGDAIYRPYDFSVSGPGQFVLSVKYEIPPLAIEYIAALITQILKRKGYGFSNKMSEKDLNMLELELPANEYSQPDCEFMAYSQLLRNKRQEGYLETLKY